jgi:hypothetical protein
LREWIANKSCRFLNAWKIGYARTIRFVWSLFLLAGFLPELHFGLVDPEATGRPHAPQQKGTALHGFT